MPLFKIVNLVFFLIEALGSNVLQGTGYWEFLLQERGVDVLAFDENTVYPTEMRYLEIMVISELNIISGW